MAVVISIAFLIFVVILTVILNSIDEKKEEEKKEEQYQQEKLIVQAEQKRVADIQVEKLATEKAAEVERLKKAEDEKYETVFVVSTSIGEEGKHQARGRRKDDTYVSVSSPNALIAGSNLKQLKEQLNKWKWFSVTEFERLKSKKEQPRQIELPKPQLQIGLNSKQPNFPQLFESNTEYSNELNKLICLNYSHTFAMYPNIQKLSKDCKVWDELNQGVKILSTPEQLLQYVYSYGSMHKSKLNQAFETCINPAHYKPNGQNISIIDYGCGQGLGVVALVDFLYARTNFDCGFEKITLIEPSEVALKRASFHTYALLEKLDKKSEAITQQIIPILKTLDEINEADLETSKESTKFHILSNVLDIKNYNVQALCKKIAATQTGENYFICVSPNFWSGNVKLDDFINYFSVLYQVTVISQRDSNIKSPDAKVWTRYEKVFKSNFLNKIEQNNLSSFPMSDDDLPF